MTVGMLFLCYQVLTEVYPFKKNIGCTIGGTGSIQVGTYVGIRVRNSSVSMSPFLQDFCLSVFLRPASLPLCAFFKSTPSFSSTDLSRSRDSVWNIIRSHQADTVLPPCNPVTYLYSKLALSYFLFLECNSSTLDYKTHTLTAPTWLHLMKAGTVILCIKSRWMSEMEKL